MNAQPATTMRGLAQVLQSLRGDRDRIDPQPITRGLKIRTLRQLIVKRLPAFGIETGPNPSVHASGSDPLIDSWYTQSSGQYARVVEVAGRGSVSTWPSRDLRNGGRYQPLPAYSDVQRIAATADYVYITATGLPSHSVGPWPDDVPAWPVQHRRNYRIPRRPWLAETGIVTAPGDVGVWVNGIPIPGLVGNRLYENAARRSDYNVASEPYRELWLRCPLVVDSAAVDPSGGQPDASGDYRYIGNPVALRSQLRDNVVYLPRSDRYREDINNLRHSPILGWTFEGLPIYGPYGYADPLDPMSGVRRMVSGFVPRDGRSNNTGITVAGRRSLPRWAASLHGTGEKLAPAEWGPDVAVGCELGTFVEDYDYLGDLGQVQGRDFDLDQCNGRYCVTPEFPDGTFAYFVSLNYDGSPAFPFVVGPRSYGVRDGGVAERIPAEAETLVAAGPASPIRVDFRNIGAQQMLTWTSVEGGKYRVDASHDGKNWINLAGDIRSQGLTTEHTVYLAPGIRPYRHLHVTLTGLDPHAS